MYRFNSLNEYNDRLDQLTQEIQWLRLHTTDLHMIIDYEQLKVSYIVERKEFLEDIYSTH